jgi:hypothetical protein
MSLLRDLAPIWAVLVLAIGLILYNFLNTPAKATFGRPPKNFCLPHSTPDILSMPGYEGVDAQVITTCSPRDHVRITWDVQPSRWPGADTEADGEYWVNMSITRLSDNHEVYRIGFGKPSRGSDVLRTDCSSGCRVYILSSFLAYTITLTRDTHKELLVDARPVGNWA